MRATRSCSCMDGRIRGFRSAGSQNSSPTATARCCWTSADSESRNVQTLGTASAIWLQMSPPSSMNCLSSARRSSGTRSGALLRAAWRSTIPRECERLVLIGTGWLGSNDVLREVHASLRDLADPVSRDFARDFQASTAFAPVPEPFFEQLVTESLKLPSRLWPELLGSIVKYDDRSELGRISAPTLLLWGDRDAIFSREDQDHLAAVIPHVTCGFTRRSATVPTGNARTTSRATW